MKREAPSTSDQVIDSRDVIARIEELEGERETFSDALTEARETLADFADDTSAIDEDERSAQQDTVEAAELALQEWDEGDEGQEMKALLALQNEAEGYSPDWTYGSTLIREDYFPDYCQELLADIGALRNLPDYLVIDWEATADNLKADYTEVDFDGTTYLIR